MNEIYPILCPLCSGIILFSEYYGQCISCRQQFEPKIEYNLTHNLKTFHLVERKKEEEESL
jgi:uncharacterized CHY-type Zn-finger protein